MCPPDWAAGLPEELPPKKQSESHVCDVCDMTFSSKETLKRYQESMHRQSKETPHEKTLNKYESPSTYICDICHKSFHNEDNYREHLKHTPVKQYQQLHPPVHDSHDDSRACPPDSTASLSEEPCPKKPSESRVQHL